MRTVAFALLLASSASHAQASQDMGGDVVSCRPANENAFRGTVSLDYLQTTSELSQWQPVGVASFEASRDRLLKGLYEKHLAFALHFDDFLSDLANHDDWTRPMIWLDSPLTLVDTADEAMLRQIPSNCRDAAGKPLMAQVITRQHKRSVTVFEYDAKILGDLRPGEPLQYSFVVLHAFLRGLHSDIQMVRRANAFLHSSALDTLTGGALQAALEEMGFSPERHRRSYCHRSERVRLAIERTSGQRCLQLDREGERNVTEISVAKGGKLRRGDFEGVSQVKLEFDGGDDLAAELASLLSSDRSKIHTLFVSGPRRGVLPTGLFDDSSYTDLRHVALVGLGFRKLPGAFFRGLELDRIDLQNNRLEILSDVSLAQVLAKDGVLDASANALIHVSDAFLKALPPGARLILRGNAFSEDEVNRLRKSALSFGVAIEL